MGTIYSLQRWLERPEHGKPRWVPVDQYPTMEEANKRFLGAREGWHRIVELELPDHQPGEPVKEE